jgi:hypothetical protein
MIPNALNIFPAQKKSLREKTPAYLESCVKAGADMVDFAKNQGLRASYAEKKRNLDLAANILDSKDVERVTNPWKLQGVDFPLEMRNYPLTKPKIDLLVGEEIKRKFDWRIVVKNDDAISDKETLIKDAYMQFLSKKVTDKGYDEKKTQQELQELEQWALYEAQDIRERMATQLLTVLYKEEELQYKFNKGFEFALIAGEELYSIQIVGGEPRVFIEDPLTIFTVRSGDSPFIEDSDIIIKDVYRPIGSVIDDYYEFLTPRDIDKLEKGTHSTSPTKYNELPNWSIPQNYYMEAFDQPIVLPAFDMNHLNDGWFDADGNVRVTQVMWKSLRKLGKRTYFDENDTIQEEFVDEFYPINESVGEDIEWLWVTEWWEGTRIGEDIFVKMQPLPRIGLSMNNPSRCLPPVVGTIYNTGSNKAMSLMSYMAPYQYLYNAIMFQTELAVAKNRGKVGWIPLHLIPDGWTMDNWLGYVLNMNLGVIDMFKEGRKGLATGKLAGNMQAMPAPMDLEMSQYIVANIQIAQMIKQHVDDISGVSQQRQGQIDNRELVGNVERSVIQSSHITEKWFFLHDMTKLRVLEALLETAKYAWRHKTKKLQFIMDDMTMAMLEFDGENFATAEYGLFASNASNDMATSQALKNLAEAGIQNQKLNFSDIMTIYMAESMASVRRKIQASEKKQEEAVAAQRQAEQEQFMADVKQRSDSEQSDRDLAKYKIDVEAETAITVASMRQTEQPEVSEPIDTGIDEEKLALDAKKHNDTIALKREELASKRKESERKLNQKDEEIQIKRKVANKPTPKTK